LPGQTRLSSGTEDFLTLYIKILINADIVPPERLDLDPETHLALLPEFNPFLTVYDLFWCFGSLLDFRQWKRLKKEGQNSGLAKGVCGRKR
jgi:hypothetical protein